MLLGAELPVLTCFWTPGFLPAPGNDTGAETFSSVAAAVEALTARLLPKGVEPQAEVAVPAPA